MENVKLTPELQVTALCYLLALFALERLKGRCAAHMSSAERGKQMEACSEHIPQKTPSCQSRFYYFFLLHTNASHRSCTLCHFRLLVCVKTTEQESAALLRGYAAARFYYLVSAEPNSLLSNSNMSAARCLALRLKCDMKS